jgi:hypothetical protein
MGKSQSQFAALRSKWLEQLCGNDRNSVQNQLARVSWDLAAYETVEECVALAPPADEGYVQCNDLVIGLIRGCVAERLLVSARRLNDRGTDKRTISLATILSTMRRNVHEFTRTNLITSFEYSLGQYSAEHRADFIEHEQGLIDRLVKNAEGKRSGEDRIPVEVFDKLIEKLERKARKLTDYVNKFIAHSEGPGGTKRAAVEKIPISFSELRECHQAYCETLSFLRTVFFGEASPPTLAYPQFDQFENLDRPLISAEDLPKLQARWDKLHLETEAWSNWGIDDFDRELGAVGFALP